MNSARRERTRVTLTEPEALREILPRVRALQASIMHIFEQLDVTLSQLEEEDESEPTEFAKDR